MTTKIDYTLSGCANGHTVRIEGTGSVTRKRLQITFAAIEVPSTFAAGLAHFAGIDAVAAVAAGIVVGQADPVVARSRTDFLGEGGVEVGTIVALATVERQRGRIVCRAQLAEARVAMEVGERVMTIEDRVVTLVPQTVGVALFSATTVSTSRGREWTALTSTMVVGGEVGEERVLKRPAVRMTGK